MSYCMYLRKSREDIEAESHGEGETLARHEKRLAEFAKAKGYKIDKIYREIVSADSVAARAVMQELLEDVRNGMWSGVLVVEISRLARGDAIDQGIVAKVFKSSNTKIITPNKIYDPNNETDEDYFEFSLFMFRQEYKTIKKRLMRGMYSAASKGKFARSTPPYGYDTKKIENDKGFTLTPNEKEAPVVQLIYELYAKGQLLENGNRKQLSLKGIANHLDELGIKPRISDKWNSASIKSILRNPTYIGKIKWRNRRVIRETINGEIKNKYIYNPEDRQIFDGLHPALIDEETFNTVQERLNSNPPRPIPKERRVMNPLAGLLICGGCGKKMMRRPNKDAEDFIICTTKNCDNVGSYMALIESRVLFAIDEWLSGTKFNVKQNDNSEQLKSMENILKRSRKELETLDKQLDKVYDLLEEGVYSSEQFEQRCVSVTNKIIQKRKEIENLEKKIASITNAEGKVSELPQEGISGIYNLLETAEEKNEFLSTLIDKIVYTKTNGARWGKQDDFKIKIYPKLTGILG